MEPIVIVIIILIISAVGKAFRKVRDSNTRRGVPKSAERTPDKSSSDKKKGELLGWPGSDQLPSLSEDALDKDVKKSSRKDKHLYTSEKKYSAAQRKKETRAVNSRKLLQDKNDLKKGIILKEVIGMPKSREMKQKYSR